MACGVASVASPVGVNRDILADGAGLLAADDEEWFDALAELLDNAPVRAAMGSAARTQAEERWSTRVLGPRFATVLAEASA
jgi:glycosyltransferase involved in cell wall biosynthesis